MEHWVAVTEAKKELEAGLALCEQVKAEQIDELDLTLEGEPCPDQVAVRAAADPPVAYEEYRAAIALQRCALVKAEAVTRSALGRAYFSMGLTTVAVLQLERAVALRRESLKLRSVIGTREPNHVSCLAEAHRQIASTLINFGGVRAAVSEYYRAGGEKAAQTRAVLGEALTFARMSGDIGAEQGALTQLVSFQDPSAPADAATALKDLLARTGRDVDPCCIVCYEELGDTSLHALNCGHVMHKECVENWRQHSNWCPQCKRGMSG